MSTSFRPIRVKRGGDFYPKSSSTSNASSSSSSSSSSSALSSDTAAAANLAMSRLRDRLWTLDKLWLPSYKHRVVVKPTWSERPVRAEILEVRIQKAVEKKDSDDDSPRSLASTYTADLAKDVQQAGLQSIEYYCHYGYDNKKVDEWLPARKILRDCGPNMDWMNKITSHSNRDVSSNILSNSSSNNNRSSRSNLRRASGGSSNNTLDLKRKHLKSGGTSSANLLTHAPGDDSDHSSDDEVLVKNIQTVCLGQHEIDTWYYSPYNLTCDKLYICEYCLAYYKKAHTLLNHVAESRCNNLRLPGKVIYNEDNLTMFEVDGREHKLFCQHLCLLCRLFLDHKTCYYDVDAFYFYILCEVDEAGSHIVGFFSKQKLSTCDYNVACIMVLPPYQKKGYGKLLISMSYELTIREGKTGSPEKPLSDLGKKSYMSYWVYKLCKYFESQPQNISIYEIGTKTGFAYDDIVEALVHLNFVGMNTDESMFLNVPPAHVKEILATQGPSFNAREVNPNKLNWTPPASITKQFSRVASNTNIISGSGISTTTTTTTTNNNNNSNSNSISNSSSSSSSSSNSRGSSNTDPTHIVAVETSNIEPDQDDATFNESRSASSSTRSSSANIASGSGNSMTSRSSSNSDNVNSNTIITSRSISSISSCNNIADNTSIIPSKANGININTRSNSGSSNSNKIISRSNNNSSETMPKKSRRE